MKEHPCRTSPVEGPDSRTMGALKNLNSLEIEGKTATECCLSGRQTKTGSDVKGFE